MNQYNVVGTNRFGIVVRDNLHLRYVTLDNVTDLEAIGTQYGADDVYDIRPVMVEGDVAGEYQRMYFGKLKPR